MIQHLMFFWFRDEASEHETAEIVRGIRDFAEIPSVASVSLSKNVEFPETSDPFTHGAVLTFERVEDRNAFFDDVRHLDLRQKAMPLFGDLRTMSVMSEEFGPSSRVFDDDELAEVAAQLRNAEETRSTIKPLTQQMPSLTVSDAYRIQQMNVAHRLRSGDSIRGQKVGLTSLAMQEQLGVTEPDYGVLFDSMIVESGSKIPMSVMIQPRVEAEIAFVMKDELRGPGVDEVAVAEAVAGVLPVLEVIDSRIEDWQISLCDTVADNASCAKVVRGTNVSSLTGVDLPSVEMTLSVDGHVVSIGNGAAVLGDPIRGVAWLANKLAEFGVSLRPGDLVLAGALHASVAVAEGASVRASFSGLGDVTAEFVQ